jgi:hypothetical protein
LQQEKKNHMLDMILMVIVTPTTGYHLQVTDFMVRRELGHQVFPGFSPKNAVNKIVQRFMLI